MFRLGLRQGLFCLGCCWAMMLLMFAVGAMNVVWMAALGILMTIEKMATTARFSEAVGVAFVAVGFGMIVVSRLGAAMDEVMDLKEELRVTEAWSLKGELTLSCNCEVFCPCVLSLGQSAPTEGYCLTWAGVRIDEGHFGDIDLTGVKFGFMVEIPGKLGRGNWTVALFVDDKASMQASKALTWIMTGRVGGSTGIAENPGRQFPRRAAGADHLRDRRRDAHHQDREDRRWRDHAGARQGPRAMSSSATANTGFRPTSSFRAPTSRASALFGRNWNFEGRSAEICQARLGQPEGPVTLPHRAPERYNVSHARRLAFSVHVFTACGAALALLALLAAARGDWALMFVFARRGAGGRWRRRPAGARGSRLPKCCRAGRAIRSISSSTS